MTANVCYKKALEELKEAKEHIATLKFEKETQLSINGFEGRKSLGLIGCLRIGWDNVGEILKSAISELVMSSLVDHRTYLN